MSKRIVAVLLAFLALSASAAANDPFVGEWKLNPSRSTPDKMIVESNGGNKYTFNFGGGDETIVVDGTDHPTKVYGEGTLTVTPVGKTWKVVRKIGDKQMLSATWSVSGDGKTLTDHYTGFGPDGSPYDTVLTYARKAPGTGFAGTWVSTSQKAVNFVPGLQIRPYEGNGLSIVEPATQIIGNLNFAAPLVRRPDDLSLELMRKKGDAEPYVVLRLKLSADHKALTITPPSAPGAEPNHLAFDRVS